MDRRGTREDWIDLLGGRFGIQLMLDLFATCAHIVRLNRRKLVHEIPAALFRFDIALGSKLAVSAFDCDDADSEVLGKRPLRRELAACIKTGQFDI